MVINKALKEENPDKRLGFANAVAYYMKLAYNNWHKEIVHDDAIQSELTGITEGQLTFTNTPFVKAYRPQQDSVTGIEVVTENQEAESFNNVVVAVMVEAEDTIVVIIVAVAVVVIKRKDIDLRIKYISL